jgi:hypothetical protein
MSVFWAQSSTYVMTWHHVKVYAYSVIMITIVKYNLERYELTPLALKV